MRIVYLNSDSPYIIGKQGENQAVTLRVDVTEWAADFPNGTGVILFTRPNKVVYPLETGIIVLDGKTYLQTIVTTKENNMPGWVVLQAQWYNGETLVKSMLFSGKVLVSSGSSVDPTETVPDWVTEWMETLREAVEGASELIEAAETMNEDLAASHQAVSDSEAWARGTRSGEAVEPTDETYHNNSKYYSEQISANAEDVEAWANGTRDGVDIGSDDPAYHKNGKYYNSLAAISASSAASSASDAMSGTPTGYSNVVASISPNYSGTATYAVGDYCMNGGKLYRCTTAITEAEAEFVSAHWAEVNVGSEVRDLKSKLTDQRQTYNVFPQNNYFSQVQKGNPCTTNGRTYMIQPNGEVLVTGTGSSSSTYYFARTSTLAGWETFTIPAGTYKFFTATDVSSYATVGARLAGESNWPMRFIAAGNEYTFAEDTPLELGINIATSVVLPENGLLIQPMIVRADENYGYIAPWASLANYISNVIDYVKEQDESILDEIDELDKNHITFAYNSANITVTHDGTTTTIVIPGNTRIITYEGVVQTAAETTTLTATSAQFISYDATSEEWTLGSNTSNHKRYFIGWVRPAARRCFILGRYTEYGNNKTIAFMGDSITAGVATDKCFHEFLHDKYGFTCLNYGYGGSGYCRSYSGNSSGKLGIGVPGMGVNITPENAFSPNNVLTRLEEIDPSAVDCIVIAAGTNDWGHGDVITVNDFITSIEETFEYCKTNFTSIPVLVMTPIHRRGDTTPNQQNKTLREYADIIISECKKYGIAYVDTMTVSGLYPDNEANRILYFDNNQESGLHPGTEGHKRMTNCVGEMLVSLMAYSDLS